ncbi:hypothetical protein J6590_058944 [Homalodisca vitripennis]|nr:hypothetical protein J6590_058944 [Homalodisca vitripennis]
MESDGLKVTSEPLPIAGQALCLKDRIAQRSPIQAASTLKYFKENEIGYKISRTKKPSVTLNVETNSSGASEPPPMAGKAGSCKDRIAQQSSV